MNADLSPNAQAILLLTAPLLAGRRKHSKRPQTGVESAPAKPKPLSAAEYRDFARQLRAVPAGASGSAR